MAIDSPLKCSILTITFIFISCLNFLFPPKASGNVCTAPDGICSNQCSNHPDPDCYYLNWPDSNPDSNTFWTEGNDVRQIISKGSTYWYRASILQNNWSSGTLFQGETNNSGVPLPASIDTNTVYPDSTNLSQTITKGNRWWYRPQINTPWTLSGLIFSGEQNTSSCTLPPTIDTIVVNQNQGKLAETATYNNVLFYNPDVSAKTWTTCNVELNHQGNQPIRTHEAPYLGTTIAEVFSTNNRKMIYSQALTSSFFQFNLSQTPTKTTNPNTFFGSNLPWPFLQMNGTTIRDTEVDNFLSANPNLAYFRFPGGHWSEWYHWYQAIGPQDKRPWVAIPPARAPMPNSFGPIELAEKIKAYRGNAEDIMFIINYLSGTTTEAQKWVEFINGYQGPPNPAWTTEQWRTFNPVTLASAVNSTQTTINLTTIPTALSNLYQFDPAAANCDADSRDGYGNTTCNQNLYEYKKISLKIDNEWVFVDSISGTTLTVRRGEQAASHNQSAPAGFYTYNLNQPMGYFSWLRSQPGYGSQTEPYQVKYWEIANEPFFGIVSGGCNHWLPCINSKVNPNAYATFYQTVATAMKTINPLTQVGLPIESNFEFTGGGSSGSWTNQVLDLVTDANVDFVTPHFYQGFTVPSTTAEHYSVIGSGPENVYYQLSVISNQLTAAQINAAIIPNEYAIVYHSNSAYGWWSQLDGDAGLWRDSLYLANLGLKYAFHPQVAGAQYWHLYWPSYFGLIGNNAYPFGAPLGQNSTFDYSQTQSTSHIFSLLAKIGNQLFLPEFTATRRDFLSNFGSTIKGYPTPLLQTYATLKTQGNDSIPTIIITNTAEQTSTLMIKLSNGQNLTNGTYQLTTLSGSYTATGITPNTTNLTSSNLTVSPDRTSLTYNGSVPARSFNLITTLTNSPTNTPIPPSPTPNPGDINQDGFVDMADISILLANFGSTTCGTAGDLNADCLVDIFDYNLVASNFGPN